MGDQFVMHTAFSREGPSKVYVQHLLKQQGKEINELLEKKAYFYVCGDAANMAREVNTVLAQIIAEHRGMSEAKAEEIVKNMRAANQYQVCPHNNQFEDMVLTACVGGRLVIESQRVFIAFSVKGDHSRQAFDLVEYVCCWGYRSQGILGFLLTFSKPRKIDSCCRRS